MTLGVHRPKHRAAVSFRASPQTGVGIRPPCRKKGEPPSGRLSQLVDKPSLCGQRFIYAGGARGGKARLESDQMSRKALPCKACVEHPKGTCFAARSDYFRAARRHKNNDIISGCRKSRRLFRQPGRAALRAALFTSIHASVPSMFTTCTVRGMSFPLRSSAALTACSSPPQQGTSIRSSVTERMSLLCSTAASFSV